ncbi:MAG: DUF4855 domain-containing protein [Candidatus Hodarchaeota archaeon]
MARYKRNKLILVAIVAGIIITPYILLSATLVSPRGYLQPGPGTGNIHNMVLIYGGQDRDWSPDDYFPYTAYLNASLEPIDSFFDGYLFMCLRAGSGRRMLETGSSLKTDWEWWLDRLANSSGLMENLSVSLTNISNSIGRNITGKVIIMIPYPILGIQDFGNVSGIPLDFNDENDRVIAVEWFISEAIDRFNSWSFDNLELTGFYWGAEQIMGSDISIINRVNAYVHQNTLKSCWIPYYFATGASSWRELGFDFITYQPNYFFYFWADANRVHDAASNAKKWGAGVEMEIDDNIISNKEEYYHRYTAYLDGAIEDGFATGFLAYYQGVSTLKKLCESPDPELRLLYDRTYQISRMN